MRATTGFRCSLMIQTVEHLEKIIIRIAFCHGINTHARNRHNIARDEVDDVKERQEEEEKDE